MSFSWTRVILSLTSVEDDDLLSDEEDILPKEWRDLALDYELADMAIENLKDHFLR